MALFSLQYPLKDHQYNNSSFNQATYASMDVVDSWNAMFYGKFYYEDANYDGASIYFEAVLRSDGSGTGYAALFNDTPTELANSEISTTSSDNTLVRSAAVTMTDTHSYHVRVKSSGALTDFGISSPRIIADFNKTDASPIESHIVLYAEDYGVWNTPSANFLPIEANAGDEIGFSFRYTRDNWSVLTQFYWEATMIQSGTGEARAQLWNYTDDVAVSGSLVSTTSTSHTRVRSSEIIHKDGKDYIAGLGSTGADSGNASYFNVGKVIAYLPKPRKFEAHHAFLTRNYDGANQTAYVGYTTARLRFNDATWDEDNVTALYYETVMMAVSPQTIYQQLAYWTSPTARTEIPSTEISTTSTTPAVVRSGDLTGESLFFNNNLVLKSEWKVSGGSTGNNLISMGKLIFVYDTPPILTTALDGSEVDLEWEY